ncbi:hypothetical protein [Streptomyces albipurpureus]|uniref:DUF3298 domain-containing protein n=1 Tax=Streptomyces albipurpureus TaxID=2897419 RepID=A0ABT0UL18_9ACTN|nr:hypothetical protein [Streptomyces sp. CWNU-1]MCM2389160.1 hypothetical protein [Streptomyces sp. CWNU-1]
MISEPELFDGDQPFTDTRAIPEQRSETLTPREPRPSGGAGSRPWLWAIGGAVAASAIWAGGLYVYDAPKPEPDAGDWRVSRNLCVDAQLKALTMELGAATSPSPHTRVHQDQHRAGCFLSFPGGGAESRFPATATVGYTLHKRIDPGPEFEAGLMPQLGPDEPSTSLQRVEGLGEKAFFQLRTGVEPTFHVLDGQAVLSLTVSLDGYSEEGGAVPTNIAGIKASMVADLKALMARLQS